MARMYPESEAFVSDRAELLVYRALRDDPDTADWIVLHGLTLPEHHSQLEGEADFVALIPGLAAVVLEVKGWSAARPVNAGYWMVGDEQRKSPYVQARMQDKSLREHLRSMPGGPGVPVQSMVVWTLLLKPDETTSGIPVERTVFADAITSGRLGSAILANLDAWAAMTEERAPVNPGLRRLWTSITGPEPTRARCEAIAAELSPRFASVTGRRELSSAIDLTIERFDRDQLSVLAEAGKETEPRLLVLGAAGSGKTVIALHAAKRHAQGGLRVLYVCSTDALAAWCRSQLHPLPRRLTVRSASEMIGGLLPGSGADHAPFRETDPDLLVRAGESVGAAAYDEVIVDEAQTLIGDERDIRCVLFAQILDRLLEGGFATGTWRLFADPNQTWAIDPEADRPMPDFVRARIHPERAHHATLQVLADAGVFGGEVAVARLDRSYRSPAQVVEFVRSVGNHDRTGDEVFGTTLPRDSSIDALDLGTTPWQIDYWRSPEDQVAMLVEALEYAVDTLGYAPRDVVVLSGAIRGLPTAVQVSDARWSELLSPFGTDAVGERIGFGSIDEFEGMEARVVIVTDLGIPGVAGEGTPVTWPSSEEWGWLACQLYRAATRARERVHFLLPKALQLWMFEHWLYDRRTLKGDLMAPWWEGGLSGEAELRYRVTDEGDVLLVNDVGTLSPVPVVVGPHEVHRELLYRWQARFDQPSWEAYWGVERDLYAERLGWTMYYDPNHAPPRPATTLSAHDPAFVDIVLPNDPSA